MCSRLGIFEEPLTRLGDSDNIIARADGGETVALDRSRHGITSELDILEHDWVEASLLEVGRDWVNTGRSLLEKLQGSDANQTLLICGRYETW